jgi:hypothetical protein
MKVPRDRLAALLDPTCGLNGIDYVELVPGGSPPKLRVHFLTAVTLAGPAVTARLEGGDRIPTVDFEPIAAGDWGSDGQGRPLLTLQPKAEGDFSTYRLVVDSSGLDPRHAEAPVSFKAFCDSKFDCAPLPRTCPPDTVVAPAIDYLAKDFTSFRRLLFDDAAQRFSGWAERSEADFGVMLAEALSALADELSYQQDRTAADLNFATAVGRQALVAHARLVDYEPEPTRSASTELMLTVAAGAAAVAAGTRFDGVDGDGRRFGFEVGEGLAGPTSYKVDSRWNWPLIPWWWDEDEQCLARGAKKMWIVGDNHGLRKGCSVLIQTDLEGESIRQIVTLTEDGAADFDPLFPPGTGTPLTRLVWEESDALQRDRDLALTRLGGNLVPATQGERLSERYAIAPAPVASPGAVIAVEREGTNGVAVHRLPLKSAPLAWVPGASQPELRVEQVAPQPRDWNHARTLLDADGLDPAITVDLERWRAVAFADDGRPTHWEPDGDDGAVLRFGDGVFGLPAEPGAVFDVTYRVGGGAAGNLPADSISEIPTPGVVTAVRNPMPSKGGVDEESAAHVRRFAPQAFRAHPLRAVLTEDYEATARELPWVQDAGARFRWTGSWHSVFTAVDPKGGFDLGLLRHIELAQLIDRRRLAGVEAFVPPPRFVSIDLEIEICVAAGARRDEVERRVLERLAPTSRDSQTSGFFFADRFTLGTPIYRARLEEAVASIKGVKGVLGIRYRRRDSLKDFKPLPALLKLGMGEILRVDNDRDRPERGTIRIFTEGGA